MECSYCNRIISQPIIGRLAENGNTRYFGFCPYCKRLLGEVPTWNEVKQWEGEL